jgi:hypothetical protein
MLRFLELVQVGDCSTWIENGSSSSLAARRAAALIHALIQWPLAGRVLAVKCDNGHELIIENGYLDMDFFRSTEHGHPARMIEDALAPGEEHISQVMSAQASKIHTMVLRRRRVDLTKSFLCIQACQIALRQQIAVLWESSRKDPRWSDCGHLELGVLRGPKGTRAALVPKQYMRDLLIETQNTSGRGVTSSHQLVLGMELTEKKGKPVRLGSLGMAAKLKRRLSTALSHGSSRNRRHVSACNKTAPSRSGIQFDMWNYLYKGRVLVQGCKH